MTLRSREVRGFSLPELLVVIAIIGILAALLLSVLVKAKANAKRATCLNNLHQINLGTRMYCDDSNDRTPGVVNGQTNPPWIAYKELMKEYVGLHGTSSNQDRLFACPADTFYYDWVRGYVAESHHAQPHYDYSSYTFNAMNLTRLPTNMTPIRPIRWLGVGGRSLSSINPAC
jgi:prepilin-type N-terminal cleavage/methylation domain-containing protein